MEFVQIPEIKLSPRIVHDTNHVAIQVVSEGKGVRRPTAVPKALLKEVLIEQDLMQLRQRQRRRQYLMQLHNDGCNPLKTWVLVAMRARKALGDEEFQRTGMLLTRQLFASLKARGDA